MIATQLRCECDSTAMRFPCINLQPLFAGDSRVSEWTGLTTQHTVWVRQHNRIEQKLHELNPHWDGERLYQETRRIVVALWQFAIYNEYLPVILGHDAMLDHDLQLVHSGYWNGKSTSVL